MKNNVRFPYGVSDFKSLVSEGYVFVDRTEHIELIERAGEKFLFFFRPRRFGKSLLISILQHYYGLEHKELFDKLFGQFYIGKNKTAIANTFHILRFDFSGIDTATRESTFNNFLGKVKAGVLSLMSRYSSLFSEKDRQAIESQSSPNQVVQELFAVFERNKVKQKIYVLIDEYDHFTNELMAFRLDEFKETVSQNGYVRKFFEMLKEGAGAGFVDRMFATGVSPVTLDSLTSGFNIGKDISLNILFAEMAGFTEEEVLGLLKLLPARGGPEPESYLPELRKWYNGYRFHLSAKRSIYNPGMILYFCTEYLSNSGFPPELLDVNVASDYGKIRRLFELGQTERNYAVLRELLEQGRVGAQLTQQFSFEKPFTRDDFISLLYYLGHLTLAPSLPGFPEFKVPNFVIKKLFLDYFFHLLEQRDKVPIDTRQLRNAMVELAIHGSPKLFFGYVADILRHLSNRDYRNFTEKHLKVIIIATALQSDIYYVKSERETNGGYTDIQFLQRPPFPVNSQYLFELKYLKKEEAGKLKNVQAEARQQLLAYLDSDPELRERPGLQCWTVVVVKDEIMLEQVG